MSPGINKFIGKKINFKNLPSPLFAKEGRDTSLWQREGRRDFPINNRGMALVLTLMVVSLITAMVVEFAYGVYVSTSALHNWQISQQLSLAARSATQLATRLIVEKKTLTPNYTSTSVFEMSQKIPFEELEGTITIRIEDENARFNINTLVYATGALNDSAYASSIRLLKALELKPEIADRIVDWIDPNSTPRIQGSEDGAKNAPLDSVDELLIIPGIDQETFDRLKPYVTIYGSNRINLNSAEVPALRSLHEKIDKGMAENIINYRKTTPFQSVTDIKQVGSVPQELSIALGSAADVNSNTFRIVATATSGDIKRIIESVVDFSGLERKVRYWREY